MAKTGRPIGRNVKKCGNCKFGEKGTHGIMRWQIWCTKIRRFRGRTGYACKYYKKKEDC